MDVHRPGMRAGDKSWVTNRSGKVCTDLYLHCPSFYSTKSTLLPYFCYMRHGVVTMPVLSYSSDNFLWDSGESTGRCAREKVKKEEILSDVIAIVMIVRSQMMKIQLDQVPWTIYSKSKVIVDWFCLPILALNELTNRKALIFCLVVLDFCSWKKPCWNG